MVNFQFFMDTFKITVSELESSFTKILTQKKRTSEKIESATIQLLNFKCQMLKSVNNLVKQITNQKSQDQKQLIKSKNNFSKSKEKDANTMEVEIQQNSNKLMKYRLHMLLRGKLLKFKKQSFIRSSFEQKEETDSICKLEQSVILIEKDLGIENEDQLLTDKYNISSIINKSLLSLEETPIRDKMESHDFNHSIESSMHLNFHYHQQEEVRSIANTSFDLEDSIVEKYGLENRNESNSRPKEAEIETLSTKKPPLPVKKKKKSIYTSMDSSKKQKVLGNLLEESLQSYNNNQTE